MSDLEKEYIKFVSCLEFADAAGEMLETELSDGDRCFYQEQETVHLLNANTVATEIASCNVSSNEDIEAQLIVALHYLDCDNPLVKAGIEPAIGNIRSMSTQNLAT